MSNEAVNMTQDDINKAWERRAGPKGFETVGLIQPAPLKPTSGLLRPYVFAASMAEVDIAKQRFKQLFKSYGDKIQCDLADFKKTGYGWRFTFFLLAYRPGLTHDATGIDSSQWISVTERCREIIWGLIGQEPMLYVEPFTNNAKFQARFETYIQQI